MSVGCSTCSSSARRPRLLDPTKYEAHLATVRGLRPTVAVGAHGPGFRGAQIESAFRLLEELPYLPGAHLAQQSDLERMIRAMGDESHQSTPVLEHR